MSLLEAISCGLPCLVSSQASNIEILKDQDGRQVFEVSDIADLTKKLFSLTMPNSAELRSIGDHNRQIVTKNYSAEVVIDKLTNLYREVINQHSQSRDWKVSTFYLLFIYFIV